MVKQQRHVRAYAFPDWADVGTVQAYWEANMSLLAEDPALNLYDPSGSCIRAVKSARRPR